MAKFSKQDYVGIANVIDTTWSKLLDGAVEARRFGIRCDMEAVINGFADMFEQDNPRFDRERFVTAATGGVQ